MNANALFAVWVRQQTELGMPDPVVGHSFPLKKTLQSLAVTAQGSGHGVSTVSRPSVAASQRGQVGTDSNLSRAEKTDGVDPYARLAKLSPVEAGPEQKPAMPLALKNQSGRDGQLTFEQKRTVFKELYAARCSRCGLADQRKTFVFGAGNVDAPLMIIGEAPGAEEDEQGVPFVGAAGQLLTRMLAAIGIDRKKEVFITNVLKCRPPLNRNPESAEIVACKPLLDRQIEVIRPRLLLLLGRISAHALLDRADSIAKLRAGSYEYQGTPVMVTYHPAAILRNDEYRKPAEEDFQKLSTRLKENKH